MEGDFTQRTDTPAEDGTAAEVALQVLGESAPAEIAPKGEPQSTPVESPMDASKEQTSSGFYPPGHPRFGSAATPAKWAQSGSHPDSYPSPN